MTGGIRAWGPASFGAVAGALVFLFMHRALADDSYITLDYARNLAEHAHWGLLADRPSNTATSPLNVWLLAAGIVVTGRPVVAVGALLVVTLAAAGWWADGLRRDLALSPVLPYVVIGLLAGSPLLTSTVGLETYLGCALLLGVARSAVAGHRVVTGVLVGAAVLTRPDLAVPAAVLAVLLPVNVTWTRRLVPLGLAALVALPWHLFAWVELGGFLPDSVWFKSGDVWTVNGHSYRFVDGWLFFGREFTSATALTLAPVVAGLVVAASWLLIGRRLPGRRAALAFAGAGVAHWGAFSLLGPAPYGWYLAPSVACLTITAAIAAASLPSRVGSRTVTAVGAVLAASSAVFVATWPGGMAPMSTNWAPPARYAALADDLGRATGGAPVAANFEIGTPVFFCRCPLLDRFGDRGSVDRLIQLRTPTMPPLVRKVTRVNFWFRDPAPVTPVSWALVPGRDARAAHTWQMVNTLGAVKWGSLIREGQAVRWLS